MKQFRGLKQAKRTIPYTFTPIPRTFFSWLGVLKPAETTVYLAIVNHTLSYSRMSVRVPMTVLSNDTGLNRRSVYRAIVGLSGCGLISVSGAKKSVTCYEILTPPQFLGGKIHATQKSHEQTSDVA